MTPMIPTLVAGLIGLIAIARSKPKPRPAPVRVRADARPYRARRRG